ncbi:hypothetical protein ACET3X_009935 [Alternaria dauci]|uniref:Uncharacterized protein n=1 Tax=Alternaria dauci TaxID=48095 RepID=A0ABR3U9A3_9PLEO
MTLNTVQRGEEDGNNEFTENGIWSSEKSYSNQNPQPSIQLDETNKDEAMKNNTISKPYPHQLPANTTAPSAGGQPTVDVPPNGGYGWVCVAAVATINIHTWGLNSAYAVFLAHYLSTSTFPGATPLQYAFIGGLSISQALIVSPVATLTTRKWGTRTTLFIGVGFETVSFIGASFAITTEVMGLRDLPSALSITWLVLVLPTTFSEPIGLELVAFNGGSYTGAILFTGWMYIGAAVCLWMVRTWKIGEDEEAAAKGDVEPSTAEVESFQRSSFVKRMFKIQKV